MTPRRGDTRGRPAMELHQIRYFLAVVDAHNFTRAAERCNVSQPALTKAIKKLEAELDGPLLHRDRSGPKLTTLGELVLPRFRRLAQDSTSVLTIASNHRLRETVNSVCSELGFELDATHRTADEAWIECLVRAGVGLVLLPEYSIVSSDTLSRELVDPAVTRRIALLRNVDHPGSPAAKLLWETMLEVSSSITEGAKAPA